MPCQLPANRPSLQPTEETTRNYNCLQPPGLTVTRDMASDGQICWLLQDDDSVRGEDSLVEGSPSTTATRSARRKRKVGEPDEASSGACINLPRPLSAGTVHYKQGLAATSLCKLNSTLYFRAPTYKWTCTFPILELPQANLHILLPSTCAADTWIPPNIANSVGRHNRTSKG